MIEHIVSQLMRNEMHKNIGLFTNNGYMVLDKQLQIHKDHCSMNVWGAIRVYLDCKDNVFQFPNIVVLCSFLRKIGAFAYCFSVETNDWQIQYWIESGLSTLTAKYKVERI